MEYMRSIYARRSVHRGIESARVDKRAFREGRLGRRSAERLSLVCFTPSRLPCRTAVMVASLCCGGVRQASSHSGAIQCLRVHARPLSAQRKLHFEQRHTKKHAVPHGGQASFTVPPQPPSASLAAKPPHQRTIKDVDSGITVTLHPTTVALTAPSFGVHEPFHFDHVWLRDACQEQSSVEAASKQKLFHTTDIRSDSPSGLLIQDAVRLVPPAKVDGLPVLELAYAPDFAVRNAFSVTFSSAPEPSTRPHVSRIPLSKLVVHATPLQYAQSHGDIGGVARSWQSSELSQFPHSPKPPAKSSDVKPGQARFDNSQAYARPARLAWSTLLPEHAGQAASSMSPDEAARLTMVDGLMRDGLAFVTGMPVDTTGDSISIGDPNSPSLARLAEMLGEIRHTFYGSLWNVRSLGTSSRNIAYTNLDLGLHMDLCYFQNPPRFQFLHMLRNRVQGGQSIFVDAYRIAEEMWNKHRDAWYTLAEVPVCFEYQNDARHYRYTHPTFEVARPSSGHAGSPTSASMPRLTAVNYSPPFQGLLPLRWPDESGIMIDASPVKRQAFYAALKTFADLTHDERFRYERMLQEGECVVFDNRRVLHSRRGFEWDPAAEEGDGVKRWLKGCYVDGDAIWSTYRTLLAKARGGSLSNEV